MKWEERDGAYAARPHRLDHPIYRVVKPDGLLRWRLTRDDTPLGEFDIAIDAMRAAERDHFARFVTVACGRNSNHIPQDRVDRLIAAIESAGER